MLLQSNIRRWFSSHSRSPRLPPFARSLSAGVPPPHLAPNSKLFVAGLSWSVDEKSLSDAFSSFGDVIQARIMYDKNSGRSRGFGFVEFSTDNEASSAKDAMDGKVFLGRPLRISFAVDKVRGLSVIVPRVSTLGDIGSWVGYNIPKVQKLLLLISRYSNLDKSFSVQGNHECHPEN